MLNLNVGEMGNFLLCVAISLILGVVLMVAYGYKAKCSQSFLTTLLLLPAVVCAVIMMVNGNVGTGVAVAGAFSLVRFRSAPGSAREIGGIFIAMAAGLITGMGYLAYAALFVVILGGVSMLCEATFRSLGKSCAGKTLYITIPENLDYGDVFDEIFAEFTGVAELESVKTTNMGSLFKLTYYVEMKPEVSEKVFMDRLRCRNGNLEIALTKASSGIGEL